MRFKYLKVPLVLALFAVAVGCASGGGKQLENTVYETHRRVVNLDDSLKGSVTKLNETSAELLVRVNEGDQQTRALQSVIEENQVKLDALIKDLDEFRATLYRQFNLSQPPGGAPRMGTKIMTDEIVVRPPGTALAPEGNALEPVPELETPSVSAPAPPNAGVSNPEADYQRAQQSYANQDFANAIEQFNAFLQRYPGSENSPNAQFWKAKSLQSLERYGEAVPEFEKLRNDFPTTVKVPYAMHQQAVCHARLGQTQRAIELMQDVVENYPTTPAAEQSKSDLKKLKGN